MTRLYAAPVLALSFLGLLAIFVPSAAQAADVVVTTSDPLFLILPKPSDSTSVGTPIYFEALAVNLTDPITYSAADSFVHTTAPVGDITSPTAGDGVFAWTPAASDVGSHTLTITASDGTHAPDTATMTIVITGSGTTTDTVAPVISNTPSNTTAVATSSLGAIVTYPTPTATDNVDTSVSTTCAPASGSVFAVGTTTVTCTATDAAHNSSHTTFDIIVRDTEAPVVTLNGDTAQEIAINTTYTDPGAIVSDNVDGSTDEIQKGGGVDAQHLGSYSIYYGAVDAAGNAATTTVRTVRVTRLHEGGYSGSGPLATSTTLDLDAHELFIMKIKLAIAAVLAKLMLIQLALITNTQAGS